MLRNSIRVFGSVGRQYATAPFLVQANGPDRVGLVASVADRIYRNKGTIRESRMMKIGGEFCLMIGVHMDEAVKGSLKAALENELGLQVTIGSYMPVDWSEQEHRTRTISLKGVEAPGILAAVTEKLGSLGVNIISLDSGIQRAPFSNDEMFIATIVIRIPSTVTLAELEQEILNVGKKIDLDVWLDNIKE